MEHDSYLPLAEGVQTGQDLGVAVVIQTDAADQKLLVYLTHHWAGAPSLVLGHRRGHLNPRAARNLRREKGQMHKILPQKLSLQSVTYRTGKRRANLAQEVPGTKADKAVLFLDRYK